MALFKTRSAAVYGIDAHLIDVEVDLFSQGNARDSVMVGMPDVAVRESRQRIKSALMNSGFGYPNKRITINLAPANVRKEGAGFDLPVALGILGAMGAVPNLDSYISAGELSLDGAIRPVRATSRIPYGRTCSMNASIFRSWPEISIINMSGLTSTTRPRKICTSAWISDRTAGGAAWKIVGLPG